MKNLHPVFSDILKNFPGNGRKDLSGGDMGNPSLLAAELDRRPTHNAIVPEAKDNRVDGATNNGVNAAQEFLATLVLVLLHENAILKQRLENMAKVEEQMFPK